MKYFKHSSLVVIICDGDEAECNAWCYLIIYERFNLYHDRKHDLTRHSNILHIFMSECSKALHILIKQPTLGICIERSET